MIALARQRIEVCTTADALFHRGVPASELPRLKDTKRQEKVRRSVLFSPPSRRDLQSPTRQVSYQ